MNADFILYYRPGTCALSVHITLEYVNASYIAQTVEQHDAKYITLTGSNIVPALTTPDLGTINQNVAILAYLNNKFPKANLGASNTIATQYQLNHWLSFLSSDWHPTFWPYYNWKRFCTDHKPNNEQPIIDAAKARILTLAKTIDEYLQTNPYFIENRFTYVDTFGFATLRWLQNIDDYLDQLPGIANYLQRISAMPAVQTAMQQQGLTK